jgi:ubiquinone/menaquinone biosynthesis C-methylase UbiE
MTTKGAGLPNTYVVQNIRDGREIERLAIQDAMMTRSMGGMLPEQEHPTFSRVLDVACGTGGWLVKLAQEYPIVEGQGVDANEKMIDYANAQAKRVGLSDRVHFRVMDATITLQFPTQTFDLVNMRLGQSFLRMWDWPNIISEMLRVTQLGGTIRLVESYLGPKSSNSEALNQFFAILTRAFAATGRFPEETPAAMTQHIAPLLCQHGAKEVQSKVIDGTSRQGTEIGDAFYQDMSHLIHTLRPFLQKFARPGENFDALGQQALRDMQQPGFEATGSTVIAWGKKEAEMSPMRIRDGE